MSIPIVAIIGRPNVGKSTLFNRLLRRRVAVVDNEPGVTRDRNYAPTDWAGKSFYLVDTGGFVPASKNQIEKMVKAQVEIAISESDVTVFLVDNKVGAQEIDLEIARRLKKIEKRVVLVSNKVDNEKEEMDVHLLNRLGLGTPVPISAATGRNIGDLLDRITEAFPQEAEEETEEESIKVAVIGRPNVGKSSFVNALLGQDKLIVAESPGTTRDAIDTKFRLNDLSFTLIDTAGLRKKSKVKNDLEYYTSLRTLRSIERCDVALILIEAPEGLLKQDVRIFQEVEEMWKGMVVGVNKWDLIEKDSKTLDHYTRSMKRLAPYLEYLPFIFVSARTKQRVTGAMRLVAQIHNERKKRVETSRLNNILRKEIDRKPPAAVMGKYIKIYYCTQTDTEPPTFVFFSNYPKLLQKTYLRYLENRIRENFGFKGVPLRIKVRKRE
jgi:GTP-binding protein